jgi:regulatory protein spx
MDEKRMQVGYNEDEIRRFLPHEMRQEELARVTALVDL